MEQKLSEHISAMKKIGWMTANEASIKIFGKIDHGDIHTQIPKNEVLRIMFDTGKMKIRRLYWGEDVVRYAAKFAKKESDLFRRTNSKQDIEKIKDDLAKEIIEKILAQLGNRGLSAASM